MAPVPDWRTIGLGAAACGVAVALLYGTGVIRLRSGEKRPSDDAAPSGQHPGDVDENPGQRGEATDARPGRRDAAPEEPDDDLSSLGYLAGHVLDEDEGREGVTLSVDGRVDPNMLILYTLLGWSRGIERGPVDAPWDEVRIVDARGDILHRWKARPFAVDKQETSTARLLPDGGLLVSQNDAGIAKLDWSSKVVWRVMGLFHHDINVDHQGLVYANEKRDIVIEQDGIGLPITDNGVTILSADGEILERIWLSDVMKDFDVHRRRITASQARRRSREGAYFVDVFHLNSIEALAAHPRGLWKSGDLLVSIRNLDTVAVLDRTTHHILWAWGYGELENQHSATQTADGRLALFDNGHRRRWSRILEIDPTANEIVWTYEQRKDPGKFYSRIRGVVQWVEDRDTFTVFSTQRARIFEVDRKGDLLWEYFSPDSWREMRVPLRGVRLVGETLAMARAKLDL
jgi:hypothetical protein